MVFPCPLRSPALVKGRLLCDWWAEDSRWCAPPLSHIHPLPPFPPLLFEAVVVICCCDSYKTLFSPALNEGRPIGLVRLADGDKHRKSLKYVSHRFLCCISDARGALFSLPVDPLLSLLLTHKPFPHPLCLPPAFSQIDTQPCFITIHQVSLRHASLLCTLQLCCKRWGQSRRAGRRRKAILRLKN